MKTSSFNFSKKGKRKLSEFQTEHMTFEYIKSELDSDRSQAFQKEIESNPALGSELKKITTAISYLENISNIKVNEEVLKKLKQPSSYLNVLLEKINFDEWSYGFKSGVELLVLTVGVISISTVIPWHRVLEMKWLPEKPIILATVERDNTTKKVNGELNKKEKTEQSLAYPDDGIEKKQSSGVNIAKTETIQKQLPSQPQKQNLPQTQQQQTQPQIQQQSQLQIQQQKKIGFLFRGTIKVTNVDAVTEKFLEKLKELGGRKAGEVELGWKKGNSAYFHLTIPEAKYQNLIEFASGYGEFKIQKEKHDRIMPDGIIRIIFTIDEKK